MLLILDKETNEMADIKNFETKTQKQVREIDEKLDSIAQEAKSKLAQEDLRRNNGAAVPDTTDDFLSTIADMIELNRERKDLLDNN